MKTVQEFDIKFEHGQQTVKMPQAAEILSVKHQNHKLKLFAKVKTTEELEKRTFEIYYSGENINEYDLQYIGTVQDHNGQIWHVFENK